MMTTLRMTTNLRPLSGKTLLVTGGAKRLGRAIALAAAERGADVAITYRDSAREARAAVGELARQGVQALAVRCDVTDERNVQEMVKEVASDLGGIDVLVNNAANYETVEFGKITLAQWDAMFASNTRGPFLVSRAAKKDLRPLEDCSRQIKKSDFEYDDERNCFTCPGGHTLELKCEGKDGKRVYQAEREACEKCAYRERCCKSEKGEARTINTDDKEPQRQKMNKKMEQEDSKEVYKKRKQIVEPVFGQIKNSGFRGFLLRGYKKASGEFSLACAVHNFKKILRAIRSGEVRLGAGKMEPAMG